MQVKYAPWAKDKRGVWRRAIDLSVFVDEDGDLELTLRDKAKNIQTLSVPRSMAMALYALLREEFEDEFQ